MAAGFVDALLGYEFYLQTRGEATMTDVNAHLESKNRYPIALRTYQHYRKLIRHGFRTYVPINKFDVFQSLGKLQMAADRRRYTRRQVNANAEISRDSDNWCGCTIIDQSLVGFGILTDKKFPIRPGDKIWVRLTDYQPIPSFVAWREHLESSTRLGVRAIEFIDNFRNSPAEIERRRLVGLFTIRRTADDEIDWAYFVYILEKSNELLTSTADLLHAIAAVSGASPVVSRSLLDSIEFNSPGSAEIKIDFGIAEILRVLFEALQTFGLHRRRFRVETERIELENEGRRLDNQRKEIEIKERNIELTRNALNLAEDARTKGLDDAVITQILSRSLESALGIEKLPDGIFAPNSLERGILIERTIPAATELMNADDPSYEINVEMSDSSESADSATIHANGQD